MRLIAIVFILLINLNNLQSQTVEKRLALVIGNGKYSSGLTLRATENDAKGMSDALKNLGFRVQEYESIGLKQMSDAISIFINELKGFDVGVFYYAGHGIQFERINFLVPTDAKLDKGRDAKYECIKVDSIAELMSESNAKINIVILDACFNNPFVENWNSPGSDKGIANMKAPKYTLIASASSPGSSAADEPKGDHGMFTSSLLQSIQKPNISVSQLFQEVRIKVSQKSNEVQIPWEMTSLTTDFYFNPVDVSKKDSEIAPYSSSKVLRNENSNNKYSIDILSPSSENSVTANDKLILQACIKSTARINKILIYRNTTFINGFLPSSIESKNDCDFIVDETVPLVLGINDINLTVFADRDTIKKMISVEYSLYSARNFALIIGNQKYLDPNIPDLEEPVKDAIDMADILTSKYNFDPENVIILKNPTKSEIIGTLHKLRTRITPNDNLVIFYAGHGRWDKDMGMGYWLPKDAMNDNPVNWIPNSEITNYIGAIKTKHTLLIADACFSGGIFKTRAVPESTNYAVELIYQLNSRKALTSGMLNEVPDNSVFCKYLLKNLRENTNQYLSAEELFSKLRMSVINNTKNVPQFGTIQNVGDEGGDFIFVRR